MSQQRFNVSPLTGPDHSAESYFIVDDGQLGHILANSFSQTDAETITAALNDQHTHHRSAKTFLAMQLADFRSFLEHENGVPLNQEPDIAMLLDNLCAFLGFNTGERALALGPDLLVLLNRLEDQPATSN